MKTLFIECNMGAAGDMLTAALSELIDNPAGFIDRINGLGLDGVHVHRERAVKCGITGTHMNVHIHGHEEESVDAPLHQTQDEHGHGHTQHTHEHAHAGMEEIKAIISRLSVSQKVKCDAIAIYQLIAEAEATAHGRPVSEVHFHEVGAMDAVTDIVGVCLLIEEIAPERILVSPVHAGSGFVRCAHGVLPVPAPATAHLLRGVPTYSTAVKGELCTPTGAAILKYFADQFTAMPEMVTEKIGYGMGKKDFEAANCVRAFLGETPSQTALTNGEIAELQCNLDDMTGEAIGFAANILFENGALDVFTIPVCMKKSRPGILLVCVCTVEKADFFASLIMKHTTTFGVRKSICSRYVLDRETNSISTVYGDIRIKTGMGYGVRKSKPEYEDVACAAKANDIGILEVYRALKDEN